MFICISVAGFTQCASKALAYEAPWDYRARITKSLKTCKQVRHALVDIQNDDPDSFDALHMGEVGTFTYMCDHGITTDMHGELCDRARELKCL